MGALVLSVGFSACGGLDDRKVTRGADEPTDGGGETAGGQGNGPGPGPQGGSDTTAGGEPTVGPSPFGGETFGGAPPVVDGPPEVVDVSPADGVDDAEPTGDIGIKFSEGLDETTVTADNVQIADENGAVEGDLSYSGVVATFSPARRLSLLGKYDVSVSDSVLDAAGQALKSPFASSFTVRDGAWSAQKSVFDDDSVYPTNQNIASDARGNTLFVWMHERNPDTDTTQAVYARWYNVSSGWKAEVQLEDGADNCREFRVAVSPEGDAIVAWVSNDASYSQYTIRARRYTSGAWEDTAKSVSPATDVNINSEVPAIAIGGGQAVVAWVKAQTYPNYTYYGLQLSAAAVDADWPAAADSPIGTYYQTPNYEYLLSPAAAVDSNGLAVVVVRYYSSNVTDNSPRGVYYTRKPATGTWQSSVKIPSSSNVYSAPVLVSDTDGAMALWTATSGSAYSVMASRYTKTKQFVAPTPIHDPDLSGYVFFNSDGLLVSNGSSYFATWAQQVGTTYNTYVNHFDVASGKWDALPTLVSDGVTSSDGDSAVGVDALGNAIVAFDQDGANGSQVMTARFVASSGEWSTAEAMTAETDDYGVPHLAVGGNGVAGLFFGPVYRDGPPDGPTARGQYRLFK